MPVDLACGLVGLFEDPQSTVEATLAKIKAIPAYVKEAPAAFKEYINAIQAIEDPYEQGRALGKLLGGVMPTGAAAGGVVSKAFSKLGRWARKVPKVKTKQGRIVKKGGAGSVRVAQYSNEWSKSSLKSAIDRFSPGSKGVKISKVKTIYKNNEIGIQVVVDNSRNYFRIENINLTGKRRYLDLNGCIPNNKVVNGKTSGRSTGEYNQVTHFNNTD